MHPFITLFGIKIPAYGIMLILASFTAYFAVIYYSDKEKLPIEKMENLFLLVFFTAFLGARLFYSVEHNELSDFFKVWQGGLDFFGGFIFAGLTIFLGIRFWKLPFWKVFDVAGISILLAHSVGRLSCWLAGCCYGKPTDLRIGVVFPEESIAPSGIPLYPTQLMEATGNFIGFLILNYLYRYKPFDGFIISLYLLWYGTERFFLEFIRGTTPPIEGLGLTWNQVVCIGAIITGGSILIWKFFKEKIKKEI